MTDIGELISTSYYIILTRIEEVSRYLEISVFGKIVEYLYSHRENEVRFDLEKFAKNFDRRIEEGKKKKMIDLFIDKFFFPTNSNVIKYLENLDTSIIGN